MKKVLSLAIVFVAILALAGCVTVERRVRDRVDQDIDGNQGVFKGQAPEIAGDRPTTREYIDIRVEIPTFGEIKEKIAGTSEESDMYDIEEEPMMVDLPEVEVIEEDVVAYEPISVEPTSSNEAVFYTVKEGDSLGKIAKKFYNKASKWTLIYEANMHKVKDPQRLKPGTNLIIPSLSKESEYIK